MWITRDSNAGPLVIESNTLPLHYGFAALSVKIGNRMNGRALTDEIAKHALIQYSHVFEIEAVPWLALVAAHASMPGHGFDFEHVRILDESDDRISRLLQEAWHLHTASVNSHIDLPDAHLALREQCQGSRSLAAEQAMGTQESETSGKYITGPRDRLRAFYSITWASQIFDYSEYDEVEPTRTSETGTASSGLPAVIRQSNPVPEVATPDIRTRDREEYDSIAGESMIFGH
ncbi:unnamed protein product [Dibothriocephalus latus]|uniref:Uncharacterized protein n=1 Tax=Dibothriocephalus latus TaxID=60516 RepID=A0A3P6TES4_DIBLA|nr:unnamed protein product [Dibothriocephalus latus]